MRNIKFKNNFIRMIVILIAGSAITLSLVAATSNTTQDEFPKALSAPPPQTTLADINTPKYVIIRSSDQATFSSETIASVDSIPVKEGSQFHKNEVLLKLDCRLQTAELDKALAQQTSARMAQVSAKKLKSYGSISEFEYIKASSEAKIADAEVDKLHAVVEKCVIRAPFNGSVAELMVHEHETVKPGDPLLKIVSTDNLEFEMQVPSCWLTWLKTGTDFNVRINENDSLISAKITKINPQIEPVSRTVKIIATITPANPALLPGMSGEAIFPENQQTQCVQDKK